MSMDDGAVSRRIDKGDGHDIEWESIGPIMDPDACPFGMEANWDALLDAWNDSRDGGHRREAERGYYDRLSPAHRN